MLDNAWHHASLHQVGIQMDKRESLGAWVVTQTVRARQALDSDRLHSRLWHVRVVFKLDAFGIRDGLFTCHCDVE